jgi:hypothetical protein
MGAGAAITRTDSRSSFHLTNGVFGLSEFLFINVFLLVSTILCAFLRYRVYDLPNTLYTKPIWEGVNPQVEETVHFAALQASQEFLSYLQTNALIVDLWGLQGTLFPHCFAWCVL